MLAVRKFLCQKDALMQITLLSHGMRTENADRRNVTYKCVLGNPEKGYRRSRNQSKRGANPPT